VCNREAASVEAAAQEWADRISFVGVAWTGDDVDFQAFIDKHSLTFPQISDDAAEVFTRFEVASQPALVVVESDGSVQQLFGAVEEGTLRSILDDVS
jgi:peroxiredoxin